MMKYEKVTWPFIVWAAQIPSPKKNGCQRTELSSCITIRARKERSSEHISAVSNSFRGKPLWSSIFHLAGPIQSPPSILPPFYNKFPLKFLDKSPTPCFRLNSTTIL